MKNDSRYLRQTILPQIGEEGQTKLKESTVVVVGCGGLGSPVLTYLMMVGVGKIVMMDSDTVSLTNMNRQFLYEENDIGKEKAYCAEEFLCRRNSEIDIQAVQTCVNEENIGNLLQGAQLVIDCVDNDRTRILVSRACLRLKIPVIEAGLRGFYGYVLPISPGESACIECLRSDHTSKEENIPVIGAAAGVIGSLQAMEGIKVLLGMDVSYGSILHYDGLRGEFETIPIEPKEQCICRQRV